jgi:hypothetical protein
MSRKTPKPDSSFDDSVWLDLFEPLFFAEDTSVVERAAKLFHGLLVELENGPKGITNAAVCIENALRLIFPYTKMGRACMILFQVSLGKDFPAHKDSLAILSEAMKRTRAALELGPVSQAKERRKNTRRQ